jgi:hypothetical protein
MSTDIKDRIPWSEGTHEGRRALVRLAVSRTEAILPLYEKNADASAEPRSTLTLVRRWLDGAEVTRAELEAARAASKPHHTATYWCVDAAVDCLQGEEVAATFEYPEVFARGSYMGVWKAVAAAVVACDTWEASWAARADQYEADLAHPGRTVARVLEETLISVMDCGLSGFQFGHWALRPDRGAAEIRAALDSEGFVNSKLFTPYQIETGGAGCRVQAQWMETRGYGIGISNMVIV